MYSSDATSAHRFPNRAAALLAALFAVALTLSLGGAAALAATPLEYALIDQWPSSDWPLDTMAGHASGLAVASDGTVYLADSTVNRITVMDANGTWVKEFGNEGSGPERLGMPARLEIDEGSGRIFVSDTDSYRIVVYDLDGNFIEDWPDIYAAGLSIAPDGRLWVADILTNQIRAFTADGAEVFTFGERGSGAGKFRQMTGVSVAPSGDVYVGDRNGSRVQVFRPDPEQSTGALLRLVKTMDLTNAKYQNTTGGPGRPGGPGHGGMSRGCSARDMAAIDDETIMLYPCLVKNGEVTFLSSQQQSQGIFAFFSPYVDPVDGLYYALAITVEGADTPRDPRAVIAPAVVKYAGEDFRVISDMWKLEAFDEDRFRFPQRVDVHPSGMVYVTEWRRVYRYSPEGEYENMLPRETYPTEAISVTLQFATGDGTPDGVIGLGTCHNGANDLPCPGVLHDHDAQQAG